MHCSFVCFCLGQFKLGCSRGEGLYGILRCMFVCLLKLSASKEMFKRFKGFKCVKAVKRVKYV